MNSDMEPSNSRSEKAQSSTKRSGYFRNSKTRQGSSQFSNYPDTSNSDNSYERFRYENDVDCSDAANSGNYSDLNLNKTNNTRGYNKPFRNKYQYSSPKHSNVKYHNKEYNNRHFENPNCSEDSSVNFDKPDTSQRGKIISGRYIRSQHQISNLQLNNEQQAQNFPTERHFNKPSYNYSGRHSYYRNTPQEPPRKNYSQKETGYDVNRSASQKTYFKPSFDNKMNNMYSYDNKSHRSSSVEVASSSKETYANRNLHKSLSYDADKATQRELLIHRLNKGECECLVCCELIRTKDQIWHCLSCYHVFHLRCIKKWARSPAAAVQDGSWRCPACQSLTSKVPFDYFCFCGKHKNPEVNYHLTPHSCGEICNRIRTECSHPCKELCHPGPCPPCMIVVQKTCPCGKTHQTVPCNQTIEVKCQHICDKVLNCGLHRCKSVCHDGECFPCEEIVVQRCYCGKKEQEVACTTDTASCYFFSCEDVCNKVLNCSQHFCNEVCHPGTCKPCQLSPEIATKCCCGKSTITELVNAGKAAERLSCKDPIPVCGLVCGKILHCGPKDNLHTCQSLCHEGECPTCMLTTSLKCICGAFTKEFPCNEITESFIYTCEKRCNRRKDCGRHKCLNNCCTNIEHKCELVCNKKLSCGLHQCQETCHMGNCPTCWNVSFDELRCHCGASVLYPPIPCGTKPPECSEPCIRSHPCDHDVKHNCHSDEKCPPCTSLTTKWCYGNHKQCGPVMCFLDGISCGMPCQKPLPCGKHKCKLACHPGECLKESEKCTQACTDIRSACGHPCGNPCHEGPCPESPCKAQVVLNCPCGHRSETTTCFDSAKSYRLMSSTILATKMQEIKGGQCVNLNDVLGKKSKNNKLQCNEECAVIERNKRLAVALQIQNPDLSCSPGAPTYSEFLKDEARKNPQFVSDAYDKISNLVQLAKQSKQKCRSYSFPPMNRDHRRVIHELAEFFGCETQSYDEEPKKNVVVTAYKNKCWLPFTHIITVVQRDMGIRKGPTPLLAQREPKTTISTTATTTGSSAASGTSQKKKIDYFDYKE